MTDFASSWIYDGGPPVSDDASLYNRCLALARNLWWSWQPEVINLFRDLDPIRWRQLDHNPITLLWEFTPERLDMRASELVLHSRIDRAYRRLKEHQAEKPLWGHAHAGLLGSKPVAYFSLEFGVHESVPIYSGGLGVLSGDHIKSASGLGVPMVAIGLFYDQGYFKQHLDGSGLQHEQYLDTHIENLPMELARGADGKPISISIQTRGGPLLAKVWLMRVGRVNLYLLDCDVEGNSPEDRELTARLYGGDNRTRIRQELVAGVGGIRAMAAAGVTPGVYHLNEGHCAFATLEAIRMRMKEDGVSFDEALRDVRGRTVFTTHSPVPADHDQFDGGLIEEHLGVVRDELRISHAQLMGLGRVVPENAKEPFTMTVLGLRTSDRANAVSAIHGQRSRRTWARLWPSRDQEMIPIGHVTDGVHVQSWLAQQMERLYDMDLRAGWMLRASEQEVWQRIHQVDPAELWETHNALKNLLLAFARRRISRACRRRGEPDEVVEAARDILGPNILTIGFAHCFAAHKRADLILSSLDRLATVVNDPERPVQFIFAGKAHPADEPGKQMIKKISMLRFDPRFANRTAFIEDYDMNVCRHLVQGVDVWLNATRPASEAAGVSGQKAAMNGALNLSVLDGWWAEAYDGSNGFAIGKGTQHVDERIADARDADDLHQVLTEEVIPLYYDRDLDGVPRQWVKRMMNSIGSIPWQFNSDGMVAEYVQNWYLPAAKGAPNSDILSQTAPRHIGSPVPGTWNSREAPAEIHDSLRKFRENYPDPTRVAFIMMQFGRTPAHNRIVTSIKAALREVGIVALRADDNWYHDDLYWNVMTYIHGCGFAIAVFERIEADDFNPNVSLEVGYFFALQKPLCLLKDMTLRRLPTDLVGKLYREFNSQDPESTIPRQLRLWLADKHIIPRSRGRL